MRLQTTGNDGLLSESGALVDLVTIFPEKSFANQGLRLGVRVVLDT